MEELTIEQKARAYDEALENAKKNYDVAQNLCNGSQIGVECFKNTLTNIFPELKESEKEKARKAILNYLTKMWGNSQDDVCGVNVEDAIAWLETQKNTTDKEYVFRPLAGDTIEKAVERAVKLDGKVVLAFNGAYIPVCNKTKDEIVAEYYDWVKKQGEQKQLYIRFGEIPTDEKSKIYQGEIEIGTENGVSVYPAFKTSEGDTVLGLSLPITKTTLYTQQHLIEYDDRPCYLVKGDYVGKDTDGQPLIKNVSIIEKIDTYRVKEKKQCEHLENYDGSEQKSQGKLTLEAIKEEKVNNVNEETNGPTAYGKYVDECLYEAAKHFFSEGEDKYTVADLFYAGIRCGQTWLEKQAKQTHTALGQTEVIKTSDQEQSDNVEPKFYEGDWVVSEVTGSAYQIRNCVENLNNHKYGYDLTNGGYIGSDEVNYYHLWTIQDAKDGDVLVASDGSIFLFKCVVDCACKYYVALTNDNYVKINKDVKGGYWETSRAVHPATKEQRDLLFQKIKKAGCEWDVKKKYVKKIEI